VSVALVALVSLAALALGQRLCHGLMHASPDAHLNPFL
jgi:hypothetical protein